MNLHGSPVAGFEAFDTLLTSFSAENSVTGASLAVGRCGVLWYARSIGLADVEHGLPVEPHSLFRIASLSKPITAVAVLQLVGCDQLKLDDRVWSLLNLPEPVDPRWKQVTVHQLLQHTGGWDRSVSVDPMFRSVEFAMEQGTPPPALQSAIIHSMLKRPLDFDPGTRYAYSNFGYCLLGRIIQHVGGGGKYADVAQRNVWRIVGAKSSQLGRTLVAAKDEVQYVENPLVKENSVFTPGTPVLRPYGAWCLEAMDSHGGWIATASDMVRFAMGCDEEALTRPIGDGLLLHNWVDTMFAKPTSYTPSDPNAWYGCGWLVRPVEGGSGRNTWHTGALDGTSTLLVRRSDEMTWCILFNNRQNPAGEDLATKIDPLLHGAANVAVATLPP